MKRARDPHSISTPLHLHGNRPTRRGTGRPAGVDFAWKKRGEVGKVCRESVFRLWEFPINLAPMQYPVKFDQMFSGVDVNADSIITDTNFVKGLIAR